MSVHKIRLANLHTLLLEAGSQTALANRAGTNPAYLSQILNHTPLPSGSTRGMGARLARRLEEAFHKPEGWMDREHAYQEHSVPTGENTRQIADGNPNYKTSSPAMKKLLALAQEMSEQELAIAVTVIEGFLKSHNKKT